MKGPFARIFEAVPPLRSIRRRLKAWREERKVAEWERKGRPSPPPHLAKQRMLRGYAERFGLRVFVETGTYRGDMVEAMRGRFERIYSIELGKELYEQAKVRFAGDETVELIWGDSGRELGRIVDRLDRPALFWLDGHYSAGVTAKGERDTPILQELGHIFGAGGGRHVIVIDDASLFGSDPAYPTIEELKSLVESTTAGAEIDVRDDSIRITPKIGRPAT